MFTALLVYAYNILQYSSYYLRSHLNKLASSTTIYLQMLEIGFKDITNSCRHKALSSFRIKNSMASNVAVQCDGVSSILSDV